MAIDYNVIGSRIKQARLAKNMTQEDLADKIDVSVAFLSRKGKFSHQFKKIKSIMWFIRCFRRIFIKWCF